MELNGINREWNTCKKDAMQRAQEASQSVTEGKIVDAHAAVDFLKSAIYP